MYWALIRNNVELVLMAASISTSVSSLDPRQREPGVEARASAASSLQLRMSARPEPNMLGNNRHISIL